MVVYFRQIESVFRRWLPRYSVLIATLIGFSYVHAATAFYSKQDFLQELRSDDIDHIVSIMNDVKRQRYKGELLPIIVDAWKGHVENLPEVNWSMLRTDRVRLELADILLQANRNGLIDLDKSEFEETIHEWIENQDRDVARQAVIVLSLIDNERNVSILTEVALGRPKLFRAAVFSLSRMCDPSAFQALSDIEEKLQEREKKEFLRETRGRLEKYRCEK